MLDKPDLEDALIVDALRDAFGLDVADVAFLPLGADFDTAVYKAVAVDGAPYFVKLRRGNFDEIAVSIPRFLQTQGVGAVMAPIPTTGGQLWTGLGDFKLILYPFVEGPNGFDVALSDRQWRDLGTALRAVHGTRLPPDLARCMPRETYSPRWRETLIRFLARSEVTAYDDPAAVRLAALLRARRAEIEPIVERAARLAERLRRRPRQFVLCHTDIHGWNVLLGPNDGLFIVDWDNPCLAPKECDLMFTSGEVGGVWYGATKEALFYEGYGQTEIDLAALAYYRFERIVEDIAVTCEMVFSTAAGDQARASDREQAVQFVVDSFLPDNVVEIAHQAEG
jgi:spectinomycin phosphotransferase